ncbi:hypothetical protein V6O07_05975, partial [Arthrospira platensis SPKY2]
TQESIIKKIDGFYIQGTQRGSQDNTSNPSTIVTWNGQSSLGVWAEMGSQILELGLSMVIDSCYYGIQASRGSIINIKDGGSFDRGTAEGNPLLYITKNLIVTKAGDAGIFAYRGAHINANGAIVGLCNDGGVGYGSGFISELGATIVCQNAFAFKNYQAGFRVISDGS